MALAGDGHRRQRDIPTVADDVHEPALGEHRREGRDALHVRRHLVAVAGFAALRRVVREHATNGVRVVHDRRPAECRSDVVGFEAEVAADRRVGEEVGGEGVDVEATREFVT